MHAALSEIRNEGLRQFIYAHTWNECQRCLAQHPELLSEEVLQVLDQLIYRARQLEQLLAPPRQPEEVTITALLEQRRTLLARSRQMGIAAAMPIPRRLEYVCVGQEVY